MSNVTQILLTFGYEDHYEDDEDTWQYPLLDTINAWLVAQGHGQFSTDMQAVIRSEKAFTKPLYAGAFHAFDLAAFLAFLGALPWQEPQFVQLLVKAQYTDDARFVLLEPCRVSAPDTRIAKDD